MSTAVIDELIAAKIPGFTGLPDAVTRALRTAHFYHEQASMPNVPGSIDLSPVADQLYRALELLVRDVFEHSSESLIHSGVLQRRMDLLGYGRNNLRAMDDFESYIASLPVIRDTAFFSRLKLRKVLRAICQFRPGKRFTFDGLKAFALFFLCFSRTDCRFGLSSLYPLGLTGNGAREPCRALHVMQDKRNQAVHEGLGRDSGDLDLLWVLTARITETVLKARSSPALSTLVRRASPRRPTQAAGSPSPAAPATIIYRKPQV